MSHLDSCVYLKGKDMIRLILISSECIENEGSVMLFRGCTLYKLENETPFFPSHLTEVGLHNREGGGEG